MTATLIADGVLELWGEPLLELSELPLLGPHNADNAAAAAAAAAALGIDARADRRRRCASFAGVPHRLERVAEIDGVALRQRLEGDQRRRRERRAALVRRRRARDPRRLAQGRRLRRARRAGRRALPRLLPDRRGRRAARARPRARLGGGGRAPPLRRARRGGPRGRRGRAAAGEVVLLAPACASFDAYPRLRGSAASTSGPLVEALTVTLRAGMSGSAANSRRESAADRVLAAADRDALPARLRRRHGLQRQLDHLAARRVGRQRLLPEADADLRRARAAWSCACSPARGQALRPLTPLILLGRLLRSAWSVMLPGIGVEVNGSRALDRRRAAPDPALGADEDRADPATAPSCSPTRPKMVAGGMRTDGPVLGRRRRSACLIVGVEPDLGTALVTCFAVAALLVAAGARMRDLGLLAAVRRRRRPARGR